MVERGPYKAVIQVQFLIGLPDCRSSNISPIHPKGFRIHITTPAFFILRGMTEWFRCKTLTLVMVVRFHLPLPILKEIKGRKCDERKENINLYSSS